MSKITPRLAIVVPCYNEEAVLQESAKLFLQQLEKMIEGTLITEDSFILFVDDGSKDKTWNLIEDLCRHNHCKGVKLAKNKGHQFALLAGLEQAYHISDITISIDADLQDDITIMEQMVHKYLKGHDVVYGVRNKRDLDTFFKKFSALGFYKLMQWMGVNIVYNHADYRLASRRVIEALSSYKEVNLFLRGIFPDIGFRHEFVSYDRKERFAGESKYPLRKMFSFALDGITSFSVVPLRLVTTVGFISFMFAIILSIWALVQNMRGAVIQGWSSTIISIYFFGAVQLISLGLIGEYIGKIYREVKQRPRYIIDKLIV